MRLYPKLFLASIIAGILSAHPASAQKRVMADLPYYDDRSSPQTLIFSLYNAINRREFSRAYAYFGSPPAETLDAYASGFNQTKLVQIATGSTFEEGAAGSAFATIPLAIRSVMDDGGESVFAGCVMARRANPLITNENFRGWHIERTAIRLSSKAFEQSLPECDENGRPVSPVYGPEEFSATPQDVLPQTIALSQTFLQRDRTVCDDSLGVYPLEVTILPRLTEDDTSDTVLASFVCARGAYNVTTKWYSTNEVSFAVSHTFGEPEIDYELGPSPEVGTDGPLKRIDITGWNTTDQLINAGWDADSKAIITYRKWRGVGDAFSIGTYTFGASGFTLTKFEIDPTYDGEVDAVTIFPEPLNHPSK